MLPGTEAYAEVLNCRHGFLDRNAVLARAVMEPLEEQDMQRLRRNGIKVTHNRLNVPFVSFW